MKINKEPIRSNQHSVTLPTYIIKKVDKDAKRFEKKRAGMLAKIIIDHYEGRNDHDTK